MFSLLPLRTWLALAAIVAAAIGCWYAVHRFAQHHQAIGRAEVQERWDAANAAAEAAARQQEQTYATNARTAADTYNANLARARRGADVVRDERDRLLVAVAGSGGASGPAGAATPGGTDGTAQLRNVLGECVRTLQALAADADRLEARVVGLQDYVRAIGAARPASAPD